MSRDALVVGINQYQFINPHNPLTAPAVDAEAIAQRLQQDGDFRKIVRLPEAIKTSAGLKTVAISTKRSVSQQQLKTELKALFLPDSHQHPETALFYFSGHGLPDTEGYDKGYLAASDTNPHNPESGISLRWLQWLLSESKVKRQIVWLDCCHSGSLIINVGAANPGHGESRDRCFIASSRDFENSWEDLNSPYSVLTKALLDGLDPRRLPGTWIDTFSLVDYVNQALKGELQTPVCTNFGEAIHLTRSWDTQTESNEGYQADEGICPYKGLEYFDCNDTDPKYFFGRDALVNQLLDRVRTSNFMALVGASGNGKSSVLRAGLLHQIKIGRRIAGSDQWKIRITRPDRQPMQNLAMAFVEDGRSDLDRAEALDRASELLKDGADGLKRLIQASSASRVILVIDQFEEVFTRCDDREEREHYFHCLMGALSEPDQKLCLIIAMRADFVGKCLENEYSGLAQQVQQHMVSVLPMKPDELKAAICQPAGQVGLSIEATLVTQILNDIAGAPGSLPLLQYTLKELYPRRKNNTLMLEAYQALGGIIGTLDKRATDIYNSFDEDQQLTVQHIFQQLTQLGEGTEDTRRRVLQADLVAEPKHSSEQVKRVIEILSSPENRLLVPSEIVSKSNETNRMAIVDVAHEALIRHWKLLRQWIEQNRTLLRQQRKIEASAFDWRTQGKKDRYLLQGWSVTEAKRFIKKKSVTFPLSSLAREYIKISIRKRFYNQAFLGFSFILPATITFISFFGLFNLYLGYIESRNLNKIVAEVFLKTDLAGLSLRNTDLSNADLSNSDLSEVDLRNTIFDNANLTNALFIKAQLTGSSFRGTNLSNVIFLATDLRNTQNLNPNQFQGKAAPFLCNTMLPENISGLDSNKDCERLPQLLKERYTFLSLEDLEQVVDEASEITFPTR
ncbi:MAG: caspase family protein [Cyanobacteria bacterium P01_F01_bin.150]